MDNTLQNLLTLVDQSCAASGNALRDFELEAWRQALACSPYLSTTVSQHWAWVETDFARTRWSKPLVWQDLEGLLEDLKHQGFDIDAQLRKLRNRVMMRLIWRDFSRQCRAQETVQQVSLLAEFCIQTAVACAGQELRERFGQPIGADSGNVQNLVTLAMGKLGAGELNLSSDIDLIFVYPESGQTEGGRKSVSNQEYFIKVGQRVITLLDKVTVDGFVFRVDMRLRPYGDSGPLVMNFSAFEAYYQDQGRDWERYAMIKARALTGDAADVAYLESMLRPFVFRRYVDFSVIESLREMKRMISEQVVRKGLQNDVKLGPGGIREVEFIGQCFQLIRGGRDAPLRCRGLMDALSASEQLGCLPADAVSELREAYWFLRDSEHAIQGYQDRQTQRLPEDPDAQASLSRVMGFQTFEDYLVALNAHRSRVSRHFVDLIAPANEEDESSQRTWFWDDLDLEQIAALGFDDPAAVSVALERLTQSAIVRTLQVEPRRRLDLAMPKLLEACARQANASDTVVRLVPMVEAVLRRSAYLLLLIENPGALNELVRLCAASPWIAKQLSLRPALLDELLDLEHLYQAPDKHVLERDLALQMRAIPMDDLEAQMDALRYFKAAQVLRVAASEIGGFLPLMKVSDKLTFIAEVILEWTVKVAWTDLTNKHGKPCHLTEGTGFCVVAYGKLGGLELNYSSDLDLVFLYDAPAQGMTDGDKPIDCARFYTRLGQRVIHMLETRMSLGVLYEVDMRLRPSGNSGLLVSSFAAFERYQLEEAWTWEHQALSRARAVAGDVSLAQAFQAIRLTVMGQARDNLALADEVQSMRQKMRENLDTDIKGDTFNLKHGFGGIVDIEFMVQYALLALSAKHPSLAKYTDNIRQLEALASSGLISAETANTLSQAYLAYRSATHECALQEEPAKVSGAQWDKHRQAVGLIWRDWFNSKRWE